MKFATKLSKDLKESSLSGKNIIKTAIITFATDAMKESLPKGDYWESLGGIAVDMVSAVIDSTLTATDLREQYKSNLESQAYSIFSSAQLLGKSKLYQELGYAEKTKILLETAEHALKVSPVGEDFGLKQGWMYDTNYKLSQALLLKASGDISGANDLVESALAGARFFDRSSPLIRLDHIPERMFGGIAGYADYARKMIQILGLSK